MEGFDNLDLYHKSNVLKEHATWLITLEIEDYSVKLYAWDRFFIEQYFSEEMRVSKINIADHNDMLKYLKKISLSDLGNPTVV